MSDELCTAARALDAIEESIEDAKLQIPRHLSAAGWQHECDNPGSLWLWRRTIGGREFSVPEHVAVALTFSLADDADPEWRAEREGGDG